MNPYDNWKLVETTDPSEIMRAFWVTKPRAIGFDTETSGLHIIKDKPFMVQLGWFTSKTDGIVFAFEPTPELMRMFFQICKQVSYCIGQNVAYDLHMLTNIGYGKMIESLNNWYDLQAMARLSLEARSARDGGDNLKLKDLGVKYVHPHASNSESLIKEDLKNLRKDRTSVLASALKQFDHPTNTAVKWFRKENDKGTTSKWASANPELSYMKIVKKKWTLKDVEDFLKDPTHDVEDLPEGVSEVWLDWLEEYPEPTYADIDRELMYKYAGEDVVTTLLLAQKFLKVVKDREQLEILELERACILPKYRMERVGLKADLAYLEQSRLKVKAYIIELREELYVLAGEKVTVGQHARLQEIFDEKWDIVLDGCDKQELGNVQKNFEGEPKRLAQLISKLRTLEKWYSTYILRVQRNASYDGRVYTQINLSGAVSGRMSSDFQQFPKGKIVNEQGEELFCPRQAFLADGEMVYIDYDQIELVTQAHYTLLVSGGDLNLCRAYMPFKCVHYKTGEIYNYRSKKERFRHQEKQPMGMSAWLTEDGTSWVPSDLHTLTASKAYPHVPIDSPEFKTVYRPKGKTTNFSSNYGGSYKALMGPLGVGAEEAKQLVNGYNEAYPDVIVYQGAIQRAHMLKGYVTNRYGRRYYLRDSSMAYKLANYVVQGSCADALKHAVVKLDKYLLNKRSQMVMPVHDEIVFWLHPDEKHIEQDLLEIMQEAFEWCLVPVSAGIERSTTTWRDKSAS